LSLATLTDVIAAAKTTNYLSDRDLTEIQSFTANAAQWSKLHGGIGKL
jgi:hypothetical protein